MRFCICGMPNRIQHENISPISGVPDTNADDRVVADVDKWLEELIIPLLVQKFIDTQMSPKEQDNEQPN